MTDVQLLMFAEMAEQSSTQPTQMLTAGGRFVGEK